MSQSPAEASPQQPATPATSKASASAPAASAAAPQSLAQRNRYSR